MCKDGRRPERRRFLNTIAYYNLYQEVNDLTGSISCCNDENVRASGNIGLPEQHFFIKNDKKKELLQIAPSVRINGEERRCEFFS